MPTVFLRIFGKLHLVSVIHKTNPLTDYTRFLLYVDENEISRSSSLLRMGVFTALLRSFVRVPASIMFSYNLHGKDLMTGLQRQRKQDHLCDINLLVDDAHIACHKVILCSVSPYFEAMFSNDFQEKDAKEVMLTDMTADIMCKVVEYMYSGSIDIGGENAPELLKAADKLELCALKSGIGNHMCEQLSVENCIGFWKFACWYREENLKKNAFKFALENFSTVVKQDEYFEMDMKDLKTLLSFRDLCCCDEDAVCISVMAWLERNKGNTIENKTVEELLLDTVTFVDVDPHFLKTSIMTHERIAQNQSLYTILDGVYNHLIYQMPIPVQVEVKFPRNIKHVQHSIIYFGTGHFHDAVVEKITFQSSSSVVLSPVTDGDENNEVVDGVYREWIDGCVAENNFYIFGLNGDKVKKYQSYFNCWVTCKSMPYESGGHRVVAGSHSIYLLGGFGIHTSWHVSDEPMNEVFEYDFRHNSWEQIGLLSAAIFFATVIFHEGKIFIFGGGCDNPNNVENQWAVLTEMTDVIQVFDTETKTCSRLDFSLPLLNSDTLSVPMGCRAVMVKDNVLLIGGPHCVATCRVTASGEVLDFKTIPALGVHKIRFGLQIVGDTVYLFGGMNAEGECSKEILSIKMSDIFSHSEGVVWKFVSRTTNDIFVPASGYIKHLNKREKCVTKD